MIYVYICQSFKLCFVMLWWNWVSFDVSLYLVLKSLIINFIENIWSYDMKVIINCITLHFRWFWENVIQGVQKKISRSFCLISLATNMLESWAIIHWKGGIHRFVWSTKTFLFDIREPRYKQIKMGYHISKCLNIGQS